MAIGQNIRIARLEINMTQAELSHGFMSRVVLNRIENEKSEPSVAQLVIISKRLNVNISALIDPITNDEIPSECASDHTHIANLFNSGNYEEIIGLFLKNALESNKMQLFSYYVGISFAKSKDDKRALSQLNQFCNFYYTFSKSNKAKYVIEFATAKNHIARIMFFSKQIEKVEAPLNQAIFQLTKLNKTSHQIFLSVHQNLINYFIHIKQPKEAIRIGENLLSPDNQVLHKSTTAFMHQSLSVAYYDIDNFEKAHQHLYLADLLYSYANNEEQSSSCKINRFNLYRELNSFSDAIHFISTERNKFTSDNKQYNILGLQEAFAYINLEDFNNAENCLSQINYLKLRVQDRHSYDFVKGIVLFHRNDFSAALKKFNSCEEYFTQQKYFFDLDYMNFLRYKSTHNKKFLDSIKSLPSSYVTKNIFLQNVKLPKI